MIYESKFSSRRHGVKSKGLGKDERKKIIKIDIIKTIVSMVAEIISYTPYVTKCRSRSRKPPILVFGSSSRNINISDSN